MSGLLKLIIVLIAFYLFFRLFTIYIAPYLVKLFLKRVQKKFFDQNPEMDPDSKTKKGKVTIHRMKDKKDNEIPPDLGDYIDYEELKNNQTDNDDKN
jgi:hypothetical protein